MAIKFSIARRGFLPTESSQANSSDDIEVRNLRPQVESPQTTDAVEFQSGSSRLPSVLPKGELMSALSTMQQVMMHEFEKGNAVTLPCIGTFRLSLKGGIEVKDGNFHGKGVRVDGIVFRPDRDLLAAARSLDVDQVPMGMEFRSDDADIEARLSELVARKPVFTHKDVAAAFGQTLTRNRVTSLLRRLVKSGRLARDGKGAQTVYRVVQS